MTAPAPTPPAILVVEHDAAVGEPLVGQLAADGYRARLALTAEHARVVARAHPPQVALLGELEQPRVALELLAEIREGGWAAPCDRGLPADRERCANAMSVARSAPERAWSAGLPVIVISSHTRESDLLRAFDAGADDFLARPPGYLELRARIRALLGRAGERRAGCVEVGALAIDLHAHAVRVHERPVQLRRLEYELLLHLAREPHRVFSRQELLGAVWGCPASVPTRTLDTHASRLRRQLRADGGERWVVNVRGVGYRLI